jgi:hypothetical protein
VEKGANIVLPVFKTKGKTEIVETKYLLKKESVK